MPQPTVFVVDTFHPKAILAFKESSTVNTVIASEEPNRSWQNEAVAIAVRSETRITEEKLASAKHLKLIVKQGAGVDNIDLEAAKQHRVMVCNTPAVNSEAVAELTMSLALCVARRVGEWDRRIRSGERVVRANALGLSLFRKTIGIVGMGNIARIVAKKWIGAMEGEIIAYDPFAAEDAWKEIPHVRAQRLDEVLEIADVITLHVPLTNGTRAMVGEEQFKKMKPSAILINAARGGVVDEKALADALREKKIFGAAVDAFETEPPTLEVYQELLANENFIATPHVGAGTVENQVNSGLAVVETVIDVLGGKSVPNRVI